MNVRDQARFDRLFGDGMKKRAGCEACGERPTDGWGQTGVPGILPVEVPARLELDVEAHLDRARNAGLENKELDALHGGK
jgi:hypothetical protein